MNPILKKLGLTNQNPVLILNAPEEYREIMQNIEVQVHEEIIEKYKFIQIFVKDFAQAKNYASQAIQH